MTSQPTTPTCGPDIPGIVRDIRNRPASARTANYAHQTTPKKSNLAHFPTSEEIQTALDIIRWRHAVANIRADSPRVSYYVSRWNVPGKVARARADGTFETTTANCPPIDPAWIALVPAALAAYHEFTAQHGFDQTTTTRRADASKKPNHRIEKTEGLPAAHFSALT